MWLSSRRGCRSTACTVQGGPHCAQVSRPKYQLRCGGGLGLEVAELWGQRLWAGHSNQEPQVLTHRQEGGTPPPTSTSWARGTCDRSWCRRVSPANPKSRGAPCSGPAGFLVPGPPHLVASAASRPRSGRRSHPGCLWWRADLADNSAFSG